MNVRGLTCPHELTEAGKYGFMYGIRKEQHSSCLTLVTNVKNKREWFEDDAITAGVMLCRKYFPKGELSLDWDGPLKDSATEIVRENGEINLLIGGIIRKKDKDGKLVFSNEKKETFTVAAEKESDVLNAARIRNMTFPFCLSGRYSADKQKFVYDMVFLCGDHKQWKWNSVICINHGFRSCDTLGDATGCVYNDTRRRCCALRPHKRKDSHPMEDILFPCPNTSVVDCGTPCEGYGNRTLSELSIRARIASSACGRVETRELLIPKNELSRDCDTSLCCNKISRETRGECPCKSIKLCKNGGKCVDDDDADKWHCECVEGFFGEFCEKRSRTIQEEEEDEEVKNERKALKVGAAATVVAVVSFCIFGCIAYQAGHSLGLKRG